MLRLASIGTVSYKSLIYYSNDDSSNIHCKLKVTHEKRIRHCERTVDKTFLDDALTNTELFALIHETKRSE